MMAEDRPDILESLGEAELSLDANAELATQMLDFTRGEEHKVRVVSLHGLLKKSARMATVGNNVSPNLNIQKDLWEVEIDSVQMAQVFQNIIINGCQAMPNGGPMTISAKNVTYRRENRFQLPEGNYVVIGIEDRGCGIDPEVIGRVFDPYFTTKASGTGIGLASCKQIVERHHGRIMVESVKNSGTEFVIFLPAVTSRPPKYSESQIESAQQAHAVATRQFLNFNQRQPIKDRILVVDDDPRVRKLASEILKRLGYEAVVAPDGEKAMLLVRHAFRDARSFFVVLLDLNLPRISGLELLTEIRNVDPNVKIVLSSGDTVCEGAHRNEGWDAILSKPYGKDEMQETLMRLKAFDPMQSHHQPAIS